ncbi:MAG TPA: DEAD/DEAH box helicase [Verrucomicrobiae bacterium]|nr:DEAD/DEAH box helicase [Verrucomicrobiae bacterium]
MFRFKQFQRADYARIAMHDGAILGHDTGLGKTIAMFTWPLLKLGWLDPKTANPFGRNDRLRPAKPVLLVVPGDGHDQTDDESLKHFKTKAVRLDSQEMFLKLAKLNSNGRFILPPHYYLTSYTQLSGNGVEPFPKLDISAVRSHPERALSMLRLTEADVKSWFDRRGDVFRREYRYLDATPDTPWKDIHASWTAKRKAAGENDDLVEELDNAFHVLEKITPLKAGKPLSAEQWQFVRSEYAIITHREYLSSIGTNRNGIKCVYSPSLADLCQDCFGAIVVDEGTRIKGEETIISLGVRQINAPFRLVMSATPIKNRFPDVFRLAHMVCGSHEEPTPRFPYGDSSREDFAEEFLVSERTIKIDEDGNKLRAYSKLTPQVCNVHRAWKLFAPIILRRRKDNCGEDIVPKVRHVVRVPMGLSQAAVYQYHLNAKYLNCNGKKAVGAQLQALRIAAANPASQLLHRPAGYLAEGTPRSQYHYIPKVASTLTLIRQAMERGEQAVVFGAFNDSLDVISTRLREAGVRHLVLDGRTPQHKRGQLTRQFKLGPPRAVKERLSPQQSEFPVMLVGECMAELHSLHLCNNAILSSFSWAYDKFEQFINRIHRLNSPWPVNIWSVICEGTIDRKLEASLHEKGDASGLVLDGHLLGENPTEVNLAELLQIAHEEFDSVKTMDELNLVKGWPSLRSSLSKAFFKWSALSTPKIHFPKTITPVSYNDLPLWRQRLLRR